MFQMRRISTPGARPEFFCTIIVVRRSGGSETRPYTATKGNAMLRA